MTKFFDIHADIVELRAELSDCILTRRERAATLRRLEGLLTEVARRQDGAEGA
jgi:hypothetical protein